MSSFDPIRLPLLADNTGLAASFSEARTLIAAFGQGAGGDLRSVEGALVSMRRAAEGSLGGFAARLGPLGAALSALGPAGLAAATGAGALFLAVGKGVADVAENERLFRRLEAVLKITGSASGLTATQIGNLADAMERMTGVAAEEVIAASAGLATFTSIGRENFERTLKVANDLTAVFGGSLKENVDRVARALDDPIEGFAALRRSGFSLAESEKEVVEQMMRVGDVAGAQRVVLENLEKQIGGAASAQAQGLTGAFERAKNAAGNFFEEIARQLGIPEAATASLNSLADATDRLTASMARSDYQKLVDDLAATRRRISEWEDAPAEITDPAARASALETLRLKEDALRDAIRERQDAENGDRAGRGYEALDAYYAQQRAQRETATDRVTESVDKLKESLAGFETNAEKLARFRDEYQRTIASLESARTNGVDPKVVEEGLAAAETLYDRQVASIEKVTAAEDRRAAKSAGRLDGYARERASIEEQIGEMVAEYEAIGQSNRARERALMLHRLQNAAAEAGLRITPELTAANERLADSFAGWADKLRQAEDAQDALNERAEYFGGLGVDLFKGLTAGADGFRDSMKRVVDSLADAVIQAALLGQGPLASLFGFSNPSGGVGGLFGMLFGSFTGYALGGVHGPAGPVPLAPLPRFAGGGISSRPAIFGEAGIEAAVPLPDGRHIPVDISVPSFDLPDRVEPITFAPTIQIDARGAQMSEAEFRAIADQAVRSVAAQLPDMIRRAELDRRIRRR